MMMMMLVKKRESFESGRSWVYINPSLAIHRLSHQHGYGSIHSLWDQSQL